MSATFHSNTVRSIFVILLMVMFPCVCNALEGKWRGDLDVQHTKLPLVFNFGTTADGATSCTLDSPMQGVTGMTTEVMYCSEDSIAVKVTKIRATFTGHMANMEITGTFTQSGYAFPLTLTRELSLYERRPQTPKPPFPYTETDTVFKAADGVMLAGTVTLPATWAKGKPMVVMISGSGPQNRDEELFEHRPFAVIADYLARNGIASLRYDDRGTARSGGDYSSADIGVFKSDASAALAFARSLNPKGRTGLLGHSEGATIALMLAADGKADFVVSLAAATVKGKDLILAQNADGLKKFLMTQKQQDDALHLISLAFDDVIAGVDYKSIDLDKYIADYDLDVIPVVLASARQSLLASKGGYFRSLLSLEPSSWLGKIKCKVFALNGTLDKQVGYKENLDIIGKTLPKARVKAYTGLNHLFQHATTGEVAEYINIAETVSPEVLTDITGFILR